MRKNVDADLPAPGAHAPLNPADRFKVGTLQYTKIGLVMVFFWLLWGDFVFSLMETVTPSILPLKLQELGASNKTLSFLMGTVGSIMNFTLNPIISFNSDRLRTRWGRRVPILFLATPFVTFFLIVMAFGPEIGTFIHSHLGPYLGGASSATVIIATLGICQVLFGFFNMFIITVYYYLFNDVVPAHFMARFLACFRIVGTLAGMVYNYFVFAHAKTHMKEIFTGAGLLYFVVFILMCVFVKEGKYPPPAALDGGKRGMWAMCKTYGRECFTHPLYLYMFGYGACLSVASCCGFAGNLFYLHLGISLDQIGKFGTYMAIPTLVLLYPLGWLSDKYSPVRVCLGAMIVFPILNLASFFVVHDYKTMIIMSLVAFPVGTFYAAAAFPLEMLIFPKAKFGQFGSANAMFRSIFTIVFSMLAGVFLDVMKRLYGGNEEYYRWMYIWAFFFQALGLFFIVKVYRYWKQHGGDEQFSPP